MKTADVIEKVLSKIDTQRSRFPSMTYEQGVEEALMWVLEKLADDEFEFFDKK